MQRPILHRGFTLVELLVVVGIIAILISVLLPVLSSARRQATKIKCAAQMRDLGNAMLFYVQDYHGFLPCPRVSTPYNVGALTYDIGGTETPGSIVKENIKWWHFLAKYVTKGTAMAQTATDINQMKSATFWCPSFEGYVDGGSAVNMVGGYNRNITGYGMNWWPLFIGSDLGPFNSNGFPSGARQVERFSDPTGNNTTGSGPAQGTWYKLIQYRQPAERALLADARQFYLEARGVPAGQPIPGQRLNFSTNDYSNGTVGQRQTTFDFYRHGVYPSIADGTQLSGYFSDIGGKLGYNILYADLHVDSPRDRETGYRACRQRFPG